ncbi:hypothetical protein LSTR_LSTR013376 [Laodelphax striatellus]|uniref:Uncharacterized protein n=1 Tax=Laodelphax striatellus TaxID=195883 RepID=A0A482WSC2_LAOST|nr:hypothetical protein LSTR_LSTR013376 [Laodelphax striatellus]
MPAPQQLATLPLTPSVQQKHSMTMMLEINNCTWIVCTWQVQQPPMPAPQQLAMLPLTPPMQQKHLPLLPPSYCTYQKSLFVVQDNPTVNIHRPLERAGRTNDIPREYNRELIINWEKVQPSQKFLQ